MIVHEKSDLSDSPRFLLTDANHWDASRVFATWSYRWSVEMRNAPARKLLRSPQENGRVFHEFSKQLVGFESAQLRSGRSGQTPLDAANYAPFCLSCVAQSVLQPASCSGGKSERFQLVPENGPDFWSATLFSYS